MRAEVPEEDKILRIGKDLVITAFDAESLFPNLKKRPTCSAIFEETCNSNLKFKEINTKEALRFVASACNPWEID